MSKNLIMQLVDAAKGRMQTQGEFSRDIIPDLVEEVINEFQQDGLITDQGDIGVLRAEVLGRLRDMVG